jgi:signal transduction histidine kinase
MEKAVISSSTTNRKKLNINWFLGSAIMLIILFAGYNLNDIKKNVNTKLATDADMLAYRISESLQISQKTTSHAVSTYVSPILKNTYFKALTLKMPEGEFTLGAYKASMEAHVRYLHTKTPIQLSIWSIPEKKLIIQQQLKFSAFMLLILTIFIFIYWLTKNNTVKHNTKTTESKSAIKQINTTTSTHSETKTYNDTLLEKNHIQDELIQQLKNELNTTHERLIEFKNSRHSILSNMSMELRTPLDAIMGYTELLLDDSKSLGNQNITNDVSRIQSAGKHLWTLVNDVMDLAKIEEGEFDLHPEYFRLQPLINDVVNELQATISHHQNNLTVKTQEDLGQVYSDKERLKQILFNMLSNACAFTEKGQIKLNITRDKSRAAEIIKIEISDTGIGITEDNINKLFKEFSHTDDYNYDGIGFGVAISRRLSHMLGGDITINNTQNTGSNFVITLATDINRPIDNYDNELE